ncbi:hypothetical protein Tco_0722780, partial [Tanacetum coccineum]
RDWPGLDYQKDHSNSEVIERATRISSSEGFKQEACRGLEQYRIPM